MNRRELLKSALAAVVVGRKKTSFEFRPYRPGKTLCPIACVTPDDGFYLQTFFDVCPWSPSQRYLACLRLPFQDRKPTWRDTADVCVIDLQERTLETVYTTSAFGMQTGAQVQWGKTDRYLYFNDKTETAGKRAGCVRLDWQAGKADEFAGPVYHLAPDESKAVGFDLDLINHVQDGYGAVVAPAKRLTLAPGAAQDQGLWQTDLKTGRKKLLVSLAQIFEALPDKDAYNGLAFYLFHTKFNPQGTRLMQVVRARDPQTPEGKFKYGILTTFNADGSDIRVAIGRELWGRGGHHPNWHPDGERLLMNLKPKDDSLRFCVFRYDGSDFRIVSESILGSGHPSFDKTGRYIFTDAYPEEPMALANGEVPLRLIDTQSNTEKTVAAIFALGKGLGVLRLDPHPTWSRDGRHVCFNGSPQGRRQVFVADLKELVA